MKKRIILNKEKIDSIIKRLAHEIIEKNVSLDNIYIIGIKSRGDLIANKIANEIFNLVGKKISCGYVDVTFYRDDFLTNIGSHKIGPSKISLDISKYNVILVDDVLFTGRTTRAAINEIFDFGRPLSVTLVVLVERNGKELPISADIVGEKLELGNDKNIKLNGPDPLVLEIIDK